MTTHHCPKCSAELPPDAPEGLCPKCLLDLAVSPTSAVSGCAEPDAADTAFSTESVQADFPQLEIIECIGRGGMGVVYKARQPGLDRIVALKVLAPKVKDDPAFAERFQREARALARLTHPNIVSLHDFGESNGRWYFLMEYVDGISVREALDGSRLSPEEALAIVPAVCGALQYAHDRGIVHRDIKPENLLLDRDGHVKIVDFGLAKIVEPDQKDHALTGTRDVLGTPQYMAPEQFERPPRADHRADIYALGVVFYEMLTGELPMGRFAPPSRKVRVDVRLDEVVLRTLEREPERRYQQAGALKTDVESIAAGAAAGGAGAVGPTSLGANADATPPRPATRAGEVQFILLVAAAVINLVAAVAQAQRHNPLAVTAHLVAVAGFALAGLHFARRGAIKPRTDPEARRLLHYGLRASCVGLVAGLAMGLEVVWGLALAGIIISWLKLGFAGGVTAPPPAPPDAPPPSPPDASPPRPASPAPAWLPAAAISVVVFYAVQVFLVLARTGSGRVRAPLGTALAASLVAVPFVAIVARQVLRNWGESPSPAVHARARALLRAWGWAALIFAVGVCGLGAFFAYAMWQEGGLAHWNPSTDEAIVVPLAWHGSVLLPLSAWVLLRARVGSARSSGTSSCAPPRKGGRSFLSGAALALVGVVGFCLLAWAALFAAHVATFPRFRAAQSVVQQNIDTAVRGNRASVRNVVRYSVFEADARAVDDLIPPHTRTRGDMPDEDEAAGRTTRTGAPINAAAQMAEVDAGVASDLAASADACTSGGVLASQRRSIGAWPRTADSQSWSRYGGVTGAITGFLGTRTVRGVPQIRAQYMLSHLRGSVSVNAQLYYEGRAPGEGRARVFLVPFALQDGARRYLVAAFETDG
jgi:tRNA A-37 threonylcarbamoyl transferase component Bud32